MMAQLSPTKVIRAKGVGSPRSEPKNRNENYKILFDSLQGLFSDKPGLTHVLYHEIDTEDNPPVVSRPYRYDWVKQEILDYHVDKMLKEGTIIPMPSTYASPVVLCRKNNGLPPDNPEAYRFAVDYRKLNANTKYISTVSFTLNRRFNNEYTPCRGIRHVKTVVYRPQANRTERVNRDLMQLIANYVNEQHDTCDQFLREFAYAIRTAVNETKGKTPAELFLDRKRGRHNREGQVDPEIAEEGTATPTSKSEQDEATRMPDEEKINNGRTRKGKERVRESHYS
ncbi:retrovirus-related Pol polyprotein from transposon 17.6 [Trichonephila clavipes]|nr:retrovirus-related Pol polyprotein from transposon 17.6 [Trichonephila clavipes]